MTIQKLTLDHEFEYLASTFDSEKPLSFLEVIKLFQDELFCISLCFVGDDLCVRCVFSSSRIFDSQALRHIPVILLSAKKISFCDGDNCATVNAFDQIARGGTNREITFSTDLTKYNEITFSGLFNNELPTSLSALDSLLDYITTNNVNQVVDDTSNDTTLEFFDRSIQIEKLTLRRRPSTLEICDDDEQIGCVIEFDPEHEGIVGTDFESHNTKLFNAYINQHFAVFKKSIVRIKLTVWSLYDRNTPVELYAISKLKRDFLQTHKHKILAIVDNEDYQSACNAKHQFRLAEAADKLNHRKSQARKIPEIFKCGGIHIYEPKNETETVCIFMALLGAGKLPFHDFIMHEYSSKEGIDSICSWRLKPTDVRIEYSATEFEFRLSNYFIHDHPIIHTELIICWSVDRDFDNVASTSESWRHRLTVNDRVVDVIELKNLPLFEEVEK